MPPFFSLFLFFSRDSVGEVRVGRGVGARGWTTTSGVDPIACDSSSSSRLVFLRWSTMASSMSVVSWLLLIWAEGRGLGVVIEDSTRSGRSKTSKSSSKYITSNTLTASSSCVESEKITFSSIVGWLGSSTWWVPSGGGPMMNPGTSIYIECSLRILSFNNILGWLKAEGNGLVLEYYAGSTQLAVLVKEDLWLKNSIMIYLVD